MYNVLSDKNYTHSMLEMCICHMVNCCSSCQYKHVTLCTTYSLGNCHQWVSPGIHSAWAAVQVPGQGKLNLYTLQPHFAFLSWLLHFLACRVLSMKRAGTRLTYLKTSLAFSTVVAGSLGLKYTLLRVWDSINSIPLYHRSPTSQGIHREGF